MLVMKRLSRYISTNVIVCALIYVDRLSCKNNFFLTKNNSFKCVKINNYRLIITAFLVSEKVMQDQPTPMKYFTKFSRISAPEIKELEAEFLKLINYDLCISEEEFYRYLKNLQSKTESSISSDDLDLFLDTDSE